MPRIRRQEDGLCLFVGGTLNFSWQPVATGAVDYDFYTHGKEVYDRIIFNVTPRPGMVVRSFSVVVYVLRGHNLQDNGWALAAQTAILRKFGYL